MSNYLRRCQGIRKFETLAFLVVGDHLRRNRRYQLRLCRRCVGTSRRSARECPIDLDGGSFGKRLPLNGVLRQRKRKHDTVAYLFRRKIGNRSRNSWLTRDWHTGRRTSEQQQEAGARR